MRLEYLASGSSDCPLIRLSHFSAVEVATLASAVADLACGQAERIAVHELPGVSAFGGCELFLCCRAWDQAVLRVGASCFECGLTPGAWEDVAGLIEPFSAGAVGHQWLTGAPGEALLLLSASGQW